MPTHDQEHRGYLITWDDELQRFIIFQDGERIYRRGGFHTAYAARVYINRFLVD